MKQLSESTSKFRTLKINLALDIALFIALLVVYEEKATGIAIHEWLGVAMLIAIIVHILLHWQWVVGMTRRFLEKVKAEPRINYFLDIGIFIGFVTIIFTGLMISKSVLPTFGLQGLQSQFWKWLHHFSTDVTIWLAATHIAMHWKWIVNCLKRFIVDPIHFAVHPKSRPTTPEAL